MLHTKITRPAVVASDIVGPPAVLERLSATEYRGPLITSLVENLG